jgi:hypothetical protein
MMSGDIFVQCGPRMSLKDIPVFRSRWKVQNVQFGVNIKKV